jgi:uncharacterized protein (DUF58 family)
MAQRAWRSFRKRLPLTREGLFWGAVAIGILITGLAKGINLITLLACLLLVMLLYNFLLARRQLAGVRARRVDAAPPFAGTPWPWRVQLSNRSRRVAHGLVVQAGADQRLRRFTDAIDANGDAVLSTDVVFNERGRVQEGALQLLSGYPLGLVELKREAGPPRELIVLPRLGALHRGTLRALLQAPGADDRLPPAKGQRHASAQTFFHGLRPYRPGDNRRLIHWRSTARRGEIMVREFEDPPDDDLTLIVEARAADAGSSALLERLISLAATVAWEWCRQRGDRFMLGLAGADTGVIAGITGPALAQQMLEVLALERGAAQPDVGALMRLLQKQHVPGGAVLCLMMPGSGLTAQVRRELPRTVVGLTVGSDEEAGLFQL